MAERESEQTGEERGNTELPRSEDTGSTVEPVSLTPEEADALRERWAKTLAGKCVRMGGRVPDPRQAAAHPYARSGFTAWRSGSEG